MTELFATRNPANPVEIWTKPEIAMEPLCVRWTVGDVSDAGFEALRLSIHGAFRLLGDAPQYVVCVNSLRAEEAKRRCGPVPETVAWRHVEPNMPTALRSCLDDAMSEGTAWKLIPPQLDPSIRELTLDNDVVLWQLPQALRQWLCDRSGRSLVAADVAPANGQFDELCGSKPRNSGIRGVPAGFDYERALAAVLHENPVVLRSELDEQGLQIAALSRDTEPLTITTDEVSICSPFPPHVPKLGTCGAHFVGLNAREIPWKYYDRPAIDVRLEHWRQCRPALYHHVGLELPEGRSRVGLEVGLARRVG